MKVSSLFLAALFVAFLMQSCGQSDANQIVKQTSQTPQTLAQSTTETPQNTRPVKTQDDKKKRGHKYNTDTKNGDQWTPTDESNFLLDCTDKISANNGFDGQKYCDCLLDVMKDRYAPMNFKQAVAENGKIASSCLRQSVVEQ